MDERQQVTKTEETGRELVVPVTVEFEDVDSFRIAHHSKLVTYLERARLRLLTSLGLELEGQTPAPVLYELRLRFRKPARLLDQLVVAVSVSDFDDYKVLLRYRIRRGDDTLVRATSVIAFADLDDGTLTTMPDAMSEALQSRRGAADERAKP
jgi:acyl-CoA thioester hydrolase